MNAIVQDNNYTAEQGGTLLRYQLELEVAGGPGRVL